MAQGQTTSGNINAASGGGSTVSLPILYMGRQTIQVSGTWSATLLFEATINGSNWVAVYGSPIGGGPLVASTTANGVWEFSLAVKQIRVRCSAYTSGTAVAALLATDAGGKAPSAVVVVPQSDLANLVTGRATDTTGTETAVIAAQGTGVKTYVTSLVIANSSASFVTVDIKDGSTTKFTFPVPGNSGVVWNNQVPLFSASANTAVKFQASSGVSTLTVSAAGFTSTT